MVAEDIQHEYRARHGTPWANLAGADVKGVGGLGVAGLQGGFLTPPRGIGILLLPMAPPQQYPVPGPPPPPPPRQDQPPRWSSSSK